MGTTDSSGSISLPDKGCESQLSAIAVSLAYQYKLKVMFPVVNTVGRGGLDKVYHLSITQLQGHHFTQGVRDRFTIVPARVSR